MPTATSIDAAFVLAGTENDLFTTPAAGSLWRIGKTNFRSSVGRHSAVPPLAMPTEQRRAPNGDGVSQSKLPWLLGERPIK